MKPALLVSIAIIIAALILSANDIGELRQSGNVLNLKSGKVRLGQVYRERLETHFEVRLEGEKQPLIDITRGTANIHKEALEEYVKTLTRANRKRKEKGLPPIRVNRATWSKDARIIMVTRVIYESEFQPEFALIIDRTIITYDADRPQEDKRVKDYLDRLKEHSRVMKDKYLERHSFL